MEAWWKPGGSLVEPWWNPGGTLVEPSWNLTSGPPRTTPEPIWAETPKLSAVGEKKEQNLRSRHRKEEAVVEMVSEVVAAAATVEK